MPACWGQREMLKGGQELLPRVTWVPSARRFCLFAAARALNGHRKQLADPQDTPFSTARLPSLFGLRHAAARAGARFSNYLRDDAADPASRFWRRNSTVRGQAARLARRLAPSRNV